MCSESELALPVSQFLQIQIYIDINGLYCVNIVINFTQTMHGKSTPPSLDTPMIFWKVTDTLISLAGKPYFTAKYYSVTNSVFQGCHRSQRSRFSSAFAGRCYPGTSIGFEVQLKIIRSYLTLGRCQKTYNSHSQSERKNLATTSNVRMLMYVTDIRVAANRRGKSGYSHVPFGFEISSPGDGISTADLLSISSTSSAWYSRYRSFPVRSRRISSVTNCSIALFAAGYDISISSAALDAVKIGSRKITVRNALTDGDASAYSA